MDISAALPVDRGRGSPHAGSPTGCQAGGKLFGWKLRRAHKFAYIALAALLAVAAYLGARAFGIMA